MNSQPRIYRLKIVFSQESVWEVDELCKKLAIFPELGGNFEEDSWGLRDSLEIWFQEIDKNYIVIHIQKKHFARDKKYCQHLAEFFDALNEIDHIESVSELV